MLCVGVFLRTVSLVPAGRAEMSLARACTRASCVASIGSGQFYPRRRSITENPFAVAAPVAVGVLCERGQALVTICERVAENRHDQRKAGYAVRMGHRKRHHG